MLIRVADGAITVKYSTGGFVAFISRVAYVHPGRTKITGLVDTAFEAGQQLLKKELFDDAVKPIAITTDAAEMPSGDSYIAVTGHWINPNCDSAVGTQGCSVRGSSE